MAIQNTQDAFNPNTPDVAANNYMGWSRPVDYKADTSAGDTLKGAAGLLDLGIKAADAGVKASITEAVGDKVRAERDEFTKGLQGATQYLNTTAGTPTGSNTSNVPQNPLDLNATTPPLPGELQALPQTLGSIQGGRAAGKISETYYYGKLAQIASDVRSRYPSGYRDYIDNEVSKITGVDPANAYIRGLVADINASATGKDREYNNMLGELRNNLQLPGAEKVYDDLLNRRIGVSEAAKWIAYPKQEQYRLATAKAAMEYDTQVQGAKKANTSRYANEYAASQVQQHFHSIESFPQLSNPEELQKLVIRANAGEIKLSSEQYLNLARMTQSWEVSANAAIEKEFNRVGPDGKTTIRGTLTNEEANKIKNEALEPIRKLRENFSTERIDLAADTMNLVKAARSDDTYKLFNDKDVGYYIRLQGVFKENGGDSAVTALSSAAIGQGVLNSFSLKVKQFKMELATPPDPRLDKSVTSLKGALIENQRIQKKNGVDFPQTFQQLTEIVDGEKGSLISKDTTDAMAESIIRSVFGPENRESLRVIAPDSIDERGNRRQGYQSLFYRYTQPDVVNRVMATKNPELIGMYRDWVETSVTQDLFRRDISKLSEMSLGAPGAWKVDWNTTSKQFRFTSEDPSFLANANRYTGRRETPQETTIKSLNKGIDGLVNYAKGIGKQGDDIDAYIIDTLRLGGLGVDRAAGIQGLPTQLAASIKAAYTDKLEAEKKADENRKKIQDRYKAPE